MELKDLVGDHILSGVEIGALTRKTYYGEEHCNYIKFTLDGVTYSAIEDPDDGYRSYMEELVVSEGPCKIKLPNIEVVCKMEDDTYYEKNDVLLFFDVLSGKEILAIGTKNYDDYYPYCRLDYHPENMYCNRKAAQQG
jgi:hypothetical protein